MKDNEKMVINEWFRKGPMKSNRRDLNIRWLGGGRGNRDVRKLGRGSFGVLDIPTITGSKLCNQHPPTQKNVFPPLSLSVFRQHIYISVYSSLSLSLSLYLSLSLSFSIFLSIHLSICVCVCVCISLSFPVPLLSLTFPHIFSSRSFYRVYFYLPPLSLSLSHTHTHTHTHTCTHIHKHAHTYDIYIYICIYRDEHSCTHTHTHT